MMELKLIVKLNFEYRVEKMKTSTKLGNSKFWGCFNLEDLLTWQAFGSLKAMEFLSALAASVVGLAGRRSCGSSGQGITFLNKQSPMFDTVFQ